MKSPSWKAGLLLPIAGLILQFSIGCTTVENRIGQAARQGADASLVTDALKVGAVLPPWPNDCRKIERSGVTEGDRLDSAVVKTDAALGRANARVRRCAAFYDQLQKPKD